MIYGENFASSAVTASSGDIEKVGDKPNFYFSSSSALLN